MNDISWSRSRAYARARAHTHPHIHTHTYTHNTQTHTHTTRTTTGSWSFSHDCEKSANNGTFHPKSIYQSTGERVHCVEHAQRAVQPDVNSLSLGKTSVDPSSNPHNVASLHDMYYVVMYSLRNAAGVSFNLSHSSFCFPVSLSNSMQIYLSLSVSLCLSLCRSLSLSIFEVCKYLCLSLSVSLSVSVSLSLSNSM